MKTVIITGATGNLGQAVIAEMLKQGYRVYGTLVPNDPVKLAVTDPHLLTREVNLLEEASLKHL